MNTHSLAGTFALVEPHLPQALLGDGGRERLRSAASSLPAALSRCLYLELDPGVPGLVDLIVDVDAAGRDILAGHSVLRLDAGLSAGPAWGRVGAFARAWLEPGGRLQTAVRDAWLEFDLGPATGLPAPSVFVDFSTTIVQIERASSVDAIVLAAESLRFAIDAAALAMLERAAGALPPHATVLYAGFMLARPTDAIRLCIMGLSPSDVLAFLRAIDWSGDLATAREIMASLAAPCGGGQSRPALVHVDIGCAVGQTIGFEYPFARVPQLRGALAEQAVLDTLASRGLLGAGQRAALDEWPGYERRTMPHELWPAILVRRVNHVKIVIAGGARANGRAERSDRGAVRAKIYLCAEHVAAERGPVCSARHE
ncbi:MAG TPA: hypothetical protein VII52_03135 [Gemmatimonadaceae bacterium]